LDEVQSKRALFGWASAEVSRAMASKRLSQRSPDINDTEAQYLTSRDLARNQGALAWELRITTSLAQLWRGQGRHDAAQEALAAICSRFPQTAGTADLGAARSLLDDMVSLQL
jgi:predicted ATPase